MNDEVKVTVKRGEVDPLADAEPCVGPSFIAEAYTGDSISVKDCGGLVAVETSEDMYSKARRMVLNPNKDTVMKIIERIFKCNGNCPCQPQDATKDTRCPCSDFTTRGICHCKLFIEAE